MKGKKPKKKPRRVVLGVGWLYVSLGGSGWISLRGNDPNTELGQRHTAQRTLKVKGTNLRKIRLVAEVLK